MAFAVTGAFKAIEHKADIVGIIILATITGVPGGTIRDIIFGNELPNSLIDPSYVIITVSSAIVLFLLYSRMKKHWNVFLKFDAIGLGVFTVIGATFAYNLFGMNFLVIVLSGMLTAIGGGIVGKLIYNIKKDSSFKKQQSIIGGLTASLVAGYISYYIAKKLKEIMDDR